MDWLVVASIVVILVGSAFLGSAVLEGYLQVKNAPREPMFFCAKGHGHFRKGYALPIAGVLVCPMCYLNALRNGSDKVSLWRR